MLFRLAIFQQQLPFARFMLYINILHSQITVISQSCLKAPSLGALSGSPKYSGKFYTFINVGKLCEQFSSQHLMLGIPHLIYFVRTAPVEYGCDLPKKPINKLAKQNLYLFACDLGFNPKPNLLKKEVEEVEKENKGDLDRVSLLS